MNYDELISYLNSFPYSKTKYGVERMRLLVELLGYPEKKFPSVHVAGTNGKGSVCAMLENIYRNAGFKTGLFTSPHLVHIEERIQINRQLIPKVDFMQHILGLKSIANSLSSIDLSNHPTFFEFLNACAFLHFAKENVDLAFIETGLGGEFDSTNVLNPLISIITSISHDHTDILGNSIQQIAHAKAGIIKQNTPVVIGLVPPEAEEVIRSIAKQKQAPLFSVAEHFGQDINDYPFTNLKGSIQRQNAATATLACKVLRKKFPLELSQILEPLNSVNWPGRWQLFPLLNNSILILDATHNEGGVALLEENLKSLPNKPIIIFGTTNITRAEAIVPTIAKYAKEIHLVKPQYPNAVPTQTLASLLSPSFNNPTYHTNIETLIPSLRNFPPSSTVLATGSLYLIGEILQSIVSTTSSAFV